MGSRVSSTAVLMLALALGSAGCSSGDDPEFKDSGVKPDTVKLTFKDSRPADSKPAKDTADSKPAKDTRPKADWPSDLTPVSDQPQGNTCVAMTGDGIHLNPGCDPDVQVNGITAFTVFDPAGTASWLVMSGKKFWLYNPTMGAGGEFTSGGKEVSLYLKALNPTNCTDTMGGLPLNPGCDPDVQANGITSVDMVTTGGNSVWIFLSGKKVWTFAAAGGVGAFTSASPDWSVALRNLGPTSCSITMEGVTLNPGCDPDVQANGLSSISSVTAGGNVSWMLTRGKKFWIFDQNLAAFLTAGDDLAATLMLLNPADCVAITADGLYQNPGCDVDVKANGLTANGSLTTGGNTVWFMASGKKFWIYNHAALGGTGAFTDGGMEISSYFRQLKP